MALVLKRQIGDAKAEQAHWRSAIGVAEGNRAVAVKELAKWERRELALNKALLHAEYALPPLIEEKPKWNWKWLKLLR